MQAFYSWKGAELLAKGRKGCSRGGHLPCRARAGVLQCRTPHLPPPPGAACAPVEGPLTAAQKSIPAWLVKTAFPRRAGTCSWLGVKPWFRDTILAVVVLFVSKPFFQESCHPSFP